MALKEKMIDDIAVLTPKGKLMGGSETVSVHDKIKDLINTDVKKVVIDLGKVNWMNSSGLGALMGAMTSVRNADGDLKLANVTDKVQSLLMITKLITIFETYESIDEATASFK
jgi:anti-sigma B factor antagonist